MRRFDVIVIGGGLVGTAIGYGLVRHGLSVALLDEGDVAFRASRGNFGLVWVQSKGLGAPHYQRWTRRSAEEWPALAAELGERTGIDIGLSQTGGVQLCLGGPEFERRHAMMQQMQREAGNFGFEYRMLGHAELAGMLPGLGAAVTGGSWTPYDGHVNSLALFHALHRGFAARRGTYLPHRAVTEASAAPHDFRIESGGEILTAGKVVLAAGLGNAKLAPLFGLNAPVRPQRGQILVTERTTRAWTIPLGSIRQTPEGSILLGSSEEDAGFDTSQRPTVMRGIARRAVQSFPWLAELQIVRAWSALRVMPPDGLPIYDEALSCPGAFTANCHSGVTLAGAHANVFAAMVAAGELDPMLAPFSARRFDVPAAA
ncbi:MAG: FAD-binding oxidoreductase [Alphaproteobacteria bacterium]|nr:FAD-binding oxidoreductase [Alphaproteobacteria bacterium]